MTLVLPGLLAHDSNDLAGREAFAMLGAWGTAKLETEGIELALLRALGIHAAAPAPLAAIGAGLHPGDRAVLYADPVTLALGESVSIEGRVADLQADEVQAITDVLNTHFAEDELALSASRPDAWFATLPRAPDATLTPLAAAVRRPLLPRLPQGPEGKRWQRWGDEIQMLLHDHPVNRARDAAGRAPIGGIWFWGAGTWPSASPIGRIDAFADPGRVGDVARGAAALSGGTLQPLGNSLASFHDRADTVVVAALDDLDVLERRFLQPALQALRNGSVDALDVIADGHGAAVTWKTRRPRWLDRFTRRRARLVVPRPEES
ncbi:MAG TPA: hypothetical protein VMV45_08240 [Casimicrobiaceae bacterium]|nr:hypothetical protein [Casimicrobiaceae bacterium]